MSQEPDRDTRSRLLDAAHDLVESEGASQLSLRSVARRAGVSHAAPYKHFASKAELLSEVARKGFDQLDRAMADAQAVADLAPRDQLLATGLGYLLFALHHPATYQLMMRANERSADLDEPDADRCDDGPDELAGRQRWTGKTETSGAWVRLLDAVRAVREQTGASLEPALVERDGMMMWSLVHGLSSLRLDAQLPVLDDDPLSVFRPVLERSLDLYGAETPG